MRNFAKETLAIVAVAALLVIGTPNFLWAGIAVPEIDPSSGIAAITLIGGAVMLIRGLRKK